MKISTLRSNQYLETSMDSLSVPMVRAVLCLSFGLFHLVMTQSVLAQTLAIVGGTVIDGTGATPIATGIVLIDNGRISAVGRADEIAVPDDVLRVDAKGKYVIPGLMDANVHLGLSHNLSLELLVRYENQFDEIILEAAQMALKEGVTTVFDTWGPLPQLQSVRDDINAGRSVGSRIFLAGNIIGLDGIFAGGWLQPGAEQQVSAAFRDRMNQRYEQEVGTELLAMRPDEIQSAIAAYIGKGVAFLKYSGDTQRLVGSSMISTLYFSPRQQAAIVEAGHHAGLPVQAHIASEEAIQVAIDVGLDIVTHGDLAVPPKTYSRATIQRLADSGTAVSVLPFTERRLEAFEEFAEANSQQIVWIPLYRAMRENRRAMIELGVKILLSTDAHLRNAQLPDLIPIPWEIDAVDPDRAIGEAHFNALVALEEDGMDLMEVLKSATSNISEAYRVDDELGTLESGKVADLLILDRNPLQSARNYRSIHMVIKDGRIIDRTELPVSAIINPAN
ncbi:MAG: hypothetical protein EXR85_01140 [Xanthomonadales bacterium]|nr:hypothetical protein [Xanthomonadales bacterium]